MAVKKYKINQLQEDESLLELHPETDADIVNVDNSEGNYPGTATNVQDALEEVYELAQTGGVTGVKGNSESTYRTGNVNLTPANIGAEAAFTDGTATIASKDSSTSIITIKGGVKQSGGAILNKTTTEAADITLAKVAATGSYNDLSNKPTIPTVNNATLTLKAGSNTKTFTANASTDVSFEVTKSDIGLSNVTNNAQVKGLASGTTSGHVVTWGSDGYTVADSGKAFTTSVSSSSTDAQIPTAKAVYDAIDALPEPMVFKGSLGTGGTITTLPAASAANEGYVYKVITAGTYASQAAKVGDTFISTGSEWVLIPSGDEPTGTVTSVGMTVPTGLTVSGSPITSSGTLAVSYASGYSIPTTSNQTTWTNKVSSVKVGSTSYEPDSTNHIVSLPAYPTELKNPNKITINAAGEKVGDYDGSAAKTFSIAASSTAGAFTVSDGTTTKTVQLAGSMTDNNQTVKVGTTTFGANAAVAMTGSDYITVTPDTTNNNITYTLNDLPASKITSGTLNDARIPSLNASKITAGTFADARIASASTWNAKYTKPSGGIPSSDLANSGVTAGTYSAVTVNAKGLVTAGAQMIEVGSTGQTAPSTTLAVGGIFFQEI